MLIIPFIVAYLAAVEAKCDGGCTVPLAPYTETGCEAVFAKPEDCCPLYFNCAKFDGRPLDKCFYNGEVYNKGDHIDNSLTSSSCAAACFCSKSEWEDITCAHIDCPEFIGGPPLAAGCYRAYDFDSCCSKKTVCPPFDKVAKCELNGKSYYEGQRMSTPTNENIECICKPNFKGKLEKPFCTEVNCGIELRSTSNMKKKCAPVFYGSRGCPIQWECYKDGDSIVANPQGTTSDKKCYYGAKEMNIGDKLILNRSSSSPKIDCECKIPPLVTCIQKPHEL